MIKLSDAKQYKEMLGAQRTKDIIFHGLGAKMKNGKISCPTHGDDNPSMSWFENGLMWKCNACPEQIDIYRYYQLVEGKTFNESVDIVRELVGGQIYTPKVRAKKVYKKATQDFRKLTGLVIESASKRGITEKTLNYWGVQSAQKNGQEYYVFRYKDQTGKIVFNTFRSVEGKKCQREPDTKAILYGLDKVDVKKPLIITEGQFDAMIVQQCGYNNVVSVPSGIQEVSWIEHNFDILSKIKRIIIWADSDQAGLDGAEKIRSRIGKEKVEIDYHEEYKDANDLYLALGEKGVNDFIESLLVEKTEGLINMGRRRKENKTQTTFYTSFPEIDRHFKKLKGGELTLVFGRDNEGKSTFLSQVISHQLESSKIFLYSGELSDDKIESWIMRQLAGYKKGIFDKKMDEWGDVEYKIKDKVREAILKWYADKFYVYEQKVELSGKSKIFDVMELAYKKHGIKFFVIDNLMAAVDSSSEEQNVKQTDFVKKCKAFALAYDVQVILVAHPNKMGSIEGVPLRKVDVDGSKTITNISDNIIAIERIWSNDENVILDKEGKPFSCIARMLKDRVEAGRAEFYYHFNKTSLRFFNEKTPVDVTYGWEKYLSKEVQYYNGITQQFKQGEFSEIDYSDCPL